MPDLSSLLMQNPPDQDSGEFASLARLAQPQMMGNVPIGASGTAAVQYGQDRQQYQAILQQAIQQAQKTAALRGQQGQEYMAGAPGRLAGIDVANQTAQQAQTDLPTSLDTQSTNTQTANVQSKSAMIAAESAKLAPYVNLYSQAKSEDDKRAVLDMMKAHGITNIGKYQIDDVPTAKLDPVMDMLQKSQINSVPQQQKLQQEEATGDAWVKRAEAQGDNMRDVAKIRAQASADRSEAMQKAAAAKGQNMQQWEAEMYNKMRSGTMTDADKSAFLYHLNDRYAVANAHAINQPPTINPDAINTPGAPPILNAPKTTSAPALPGSAGANVNTVDLKAGTATIGGKVHQITGQGNRGNYQLDDGTVIDPSGKVISK